jgi:choline-sulfatase
MRENPLRRRARGLLLASSAVVCWAWFGCGRPHRPDVVVITIDTLRPDALGWVSGIGPTGNGPTGSSPTPAIDALAHEGFRFPGAVSPAPLTLPSHTSIFTGLVPRRHGVRDNGQVLGGGIATLAERLGAAGYRTGAFVSGYPLRRMFGLDRGFDTYDDELVQRPDGRWQDRPANNTTSLALEWLRGVKKRDPEQPFFLWIHYYDPHAPYEPPARFARPAEQGPRGAYDGEVAAVDHAIATLKQGLDEALARERVVVVTADHGESLGEHGEATHGFFVYDSTTLVPLVFHAPGRIRAGASPAAARLIDVAPTVLDLLGLEALQGTDGASLTAFWKKPVGEEVAVAPALIESIQPFAGYGWAPLTAWRTADAKWIEAPTPEFYDLASDAAEAHNLAAGDSPDPRGDTLRRALAVELKKAPAATSAPSEDPEVFAALRSLGYAGGTSSARGLSGPASLDGLADPKDRRRQKQLLDLAESLLADGDTVEGLVTFEVVLGSEPDNRYALLRAGQTMARLGQLTGAIPMFERLLALDPDHHEARFELADALSRTGQVDAAVGQWTALVERQPGRAVAWSNLGTLSLRRGELDKAEAALRRAAALEPRNPVLRGNLAECLLQHSLALAAKGDAPGAQLKLAAAIEALPEIRLRAASDARLAPLLGDSPRADAGARN